MKADYAVDLFNHRLGKAQDQLAQAELLLKDGRYDGSVNRSYYAIFSAIRALLALIKLDARKHSGVITYFDRYFVKTGLFDKHFSRIIHTAFDVRQASDYEDFYVISADQARLQFENGWNFVQEVENYFELVRKDELQLPEVPRDNKPRG